MILGLPDPHPDPLVRGKKVFEEFSGQLQATLEACSRIKTVF
jgi:hypothetical protein